MVTWDGLRQHLRWTHVLSAEEDEALELEWRFEEDDAQHVQTERLELVEGDSELYVVITAPVGDAAALDARAALEHNATLVAGALALVDGVMSVREVLSLAESSARHIERMMELVAHEAARLRLVAVAR